MEMSFTIPEGYTTMQIADLLAGLADREKFPQAAATADFLFIYSGSPKGKTPGRISSGYLISKWDDSEIHY